MKLREIIFSVLTFSTLVSCVSESNTSGAINLNATPTTEKDLKEIVETKEYVSFEDSLIFDAEDQIISHVTNVCMSDSNLFVLDDKGLIASFDNKTGKLKRAVNKKGHGNGEYVNPSSLSAANGYLYVLDVPNFVVQYDENLNYVRKISLAMSFPALDLQKTKDGFVAFCFYAPDGAVKVFDDDGNLLKSYSCNENKIPSMLATNNVIVRTDNGIFIIDAMSDTLYELKNDELTPLFGLSDVPADSDSENLEMKMYSCYPFENKVFTFYFSNNYLKGQIYDLTTHKSVSGLLGFVPSFMKNGKFYGFYPNAKDENKYILMRYKINE